MTILARDGDISSIELSHFALYSRAPVVTQFFAKNPNFESLTFLYYSQYFPDVKP